MSGQIQAPVKQHATKQDSEKRQYLFPIAVLFALVCSLCLLNAVLPLQNLGFVDALLTQFGNWPLWPAHILFPGLALMQDAVDTDVPRAVVMAQSWEETGLLFAVFLMIFLLYMFALYRLPYHAITRRYILLSTILFGTICLLNPAVSSSDIYSYIIYAHMAVIYHLNPLITLPTQIASDPVFSHLYWTNQPSVYGPFWIFITSLLQWLALTMGLRNLAAMVLALRLLGLVMHLGSTLLVWSISGHLQRRSGLILPEKRLQATLAFAWNPLLLFEACVNAHVDTTLLFFILVAIWFLIQSEQTPSQTAQTRAFCFPRFARQTRKAAPCSKEEDGAGGAAPRPRQHHPLLSSAPAGREGIGRNREDGYTEKPCQTKYPQLALLTSAVMLGLATCIKMNVALLAVGLLLFLWTQPQQAYRIRRIIAAAAAYLGTLILFYAPFWQDGGILHVFQSNPAVSRNMSTLPDFFGNLYNGIAAALGQPIARPIGSPAEHVTHYLSLSIFVLLFGVLCWRAIRVPSRINNIPGLIRWLAFVWLLYCVVGSPWFWPWYIVTFFGLFAIIEATHYREEWFYGFLRFPLTVRILAFCLLSLYCFFSWAPLNSIVPGLPGFYWTDFRGLYAWMLPILGAM